LKTCIKCRESKPATTEYFFAAPKNLDGLKGSCKPCYSLTSNKWKSTDKGKKHESSRYQKRSKDFQFTSQAKYLHYLSTDKKKGFGNDLTLEFVRTTVESPCTYCGSSEEPRGLDRLDNSLGHLQSNVVPCCGTCNFTRGDRYTPEEFALIGAAIAQIRKQRNESTTSQG
jgi:hypothetical protein